ncbi:MAG: hypothetical protein HQL56_16895 [Magnetococcales bacterium]|nr:hypothetical protein [Magnetococcales bacterium]
MSWTEPEETAASPPDDSQRLMMFAGTLDWPIDDAVDWQRQQRLEWNRSWDR